MRVALTFILTMIIGSFFGAAASAAGFGSFASFILGMAYLIGVALILNSRSAA